MQQQTEHIQLLEEIRLSINKTSELINKLGELPSSGNKNIDNMHIGLHQRHLKVIEMYMPIDDEGSDL